MNHSLATTIHVIASALALLSPTALAATQIVDEIQWTYTVSGDTASVACGNDGAPAVSTNISGTIVIPSTLGGYPVTSIGNNAFENCRSLTSVTIPDNVTRIGSSAFRGCRSLTSVTIPASVIGIGNGAFEYCVSLESFSVADDNPNYRSVFGLLLSKNGKTLVGGVNGDVVIPNNVTSIGKGAFFGYSGLVSVTIPDSVTSIRESAFADCWCLTNMTIPDSVKSIGEGAFLFCSSLTSVTIPNSVTRIEDGAFYDCRGLTNVTIGNSVKNIGNYVFENCSGLASVTLPVSITNIGYEAFANCRALTSVIIPNSVRNIGRGAFANCRALTSIAIPNSVTNIGSGAFSGCLGLTTLYMPEPWEGTPLLDDAGLPYGCTVVYGGPPEEEITSTGVPYNWIYENAAKILGSNGYDYEAASVALAANLRPVWECYVAGLSTTDAKAEFKVKSISIENGKPVVEWSPDLNENGTKTNRTYRVEGKPTLTNEWATADENSRFFRVKVSLP